MITRNPQLTNAKNLKLINTKKVFEELRCAPRCYFLVREDLAHGQYTHLPVGHAHNPAITTPQPRSQGSPGNEVDHPPSHPRGRYSFLISRVGFCRPIG